MNKRYLTRLLIICVLMSLLLNDLAVLPPLNGVQNVQAAVPVHNVVFGLFRTIGAVSKRNRVYEEARATAAEVNAYYDELIRQAQITRQEMVSSAVAGDANPTFVRSYTKMEAILEAERAAAIQMIEVEKNQARVEFERTMGRVIRDVLIASPGGQKIIGEVRETIHNAREAAVAVKTAVLNGNPIEALQDALAKQVGDIPVAREIARELGSMLGHGIDQALGGVITKVENAKEDIAGGMQEAIDLLDNIDANVARHDGRENEPVSLVEDGSLLGELFPVDRDNPVVDVAASAYAGAAQLSGALGQGETRASMRDRIRNGLLNDRLQGMRSALTEGAAGKVFCTDVDRARYEIAARSLGQTPENPLDPSTAIYIVCYEIQSHTPKYAKMYGSPGVSIDDVTGEQDDGILAGEEITETLVVETDQPEAVVNPTEKPVQSPLTLTDEELCDLIPVDGNPQPGPIDPYWEVFSDTDPPDNVISACINNYYSLYTGQYSDFVLLLFPTGADAVLRYDIESAENDQWLSTWGSDITSPLDVGDQARHWTVDGAEVRVLAVTDQFLFVGNADGLGPDKCDPDGDGMFEHCEVYEALALRFSKTIEYIESWMESSQE